MTEREKVIKGLECCMGNPNFCDICPYAGTGDETHHREYCNVKLNKDAIALLKAQEARHRLEVHNIGNVDIPEGVTEEQFHAVMNNVVEALEHTDRGESWPYEAVKWE